MKQFVLAAITCFALTALTSRSHAKDAARTVLTPVADAEVVNGSGGKANFGDANLIKVMGNKSDNQGTHRDGYFKFDVQGLSGPVRRVTLRMFVEDVAIGNPTIPIDVWSTGNDWQEDTIIWKGKPKPLKKIAANASRAS